MAAILCTTTVLGCLSHKPDVPMGVYYALVLGTLVAPMVCADPATCVLQDASKNRSGTLRENLALTDTKILEEGSVANYLTVTASQKTGTDLTVATCKFSESKVNKCPCNSDMRKLHIEACTLRLSTPLRSADGCPYVDSAIEIGKAKINQPRTYRFVYDVKRRNGTVARFPTVFNIVYIDPTTASMDPTLASMGAAQSSSYYGISLGFGAFLAFRAV